VTEGRPSSPSDPSWRYVRIGFGVREVPMHIKIILRGGPAWAGSLSSLGTAAIVGYTAHLNGMDDPTALHLALIALLGGILTQIVAGRKNGGQR